MKKINITESTVTEAMAQIETLQNLSITEQNCLRLLTEEMFSMVNELLYIGAPDFSVGCDGKKYTLRVSTHTPVSEEAREQFLSLSKDGRNIANKGIKGILSSVIEAFFYNSINTGTDGMHQPWACGLGMYDAECSQMWELSRYVETTPAEEVKKQWDGLEKSILANFSDDIIIGVRAGKLEMTVIKSFV